MFAAFKKRKGIRLSADIQKEADIWSDDKDGGCFIPQTVEKL